VTEAGCAGRGSREAAGLFNYTYSESARSVPGVWNGLSLAHYYPPGLTLLPPAGGALFAIADRMGRKRINLYWKDKILHLGPGLPAWWSRAAGIISQNPKTQRRPAARSVSESCSAPGCIAPAVHAQAKMCSHFSLCAQFSHRVFARRAASRRLIA